MNFAISVLDNDELNSQISKILKKQLNCKENIQVTDNYN